MTRKTSQSPASADANVRPPAPARGPTARLRRWTQAKLLPLYEGLKNRDIGTLFAAHRGQAVSPSGTGAASETQALAGLGSENPHCRWESAAYLGRSAHRSREAIDALVKALADPEEFVRWQVAQALAAQEAAHTFPILAEALNDPEPLRRAGAAEAMGYEGGEAASVVLCKHLTDPVAHVRVAVASALRDLADSSAADCLLPLLADEDSEVRCATAGALGRIGSPATAKPMADALILPGQPLLVRRALAAALVRTAHPEAQFALLAALSDADPQVRGYAAETLGHIGNETAIAALATASSDETALLQGTVGSQARQALTMLERRGRRNQQG
jgi:HEAT repeat protein